MNNNKVSDKVASIFLGGLCILAIFWFLKSSVGNPKLINNGTSKEDGEVILNLVSSLQGVTSDDLVEKIGEPKEVYKNKIYTYVDRLGRYDFLIDNQLSNVVITMMNDLSLLSVDKLLEKIVPEYSEELIKDYKKEVVHGRTTVRMYDVDKYSKIEISSKKDSSLIDYIKLQYK